VAVNLQSNLAPVAVGAAWLSSEDMYMAGRRGRCLSIIHFYGDQLWAAGTRDQIPDLGPPSLPFLRKEENNDQEEDDVTEEEETEVPEKEEEDEEEREDVAHELENLDVCYEESRPAEAAVESPELRSPQEVMDGLLEAALLQSLRTSASAKRAELPMLSSNLYRLHMVPNSPASLDVKKSSHKKLSKFLAQMERHGVLGLKELSKGVESVVWVDWDHEYVTTHRVIRLERPEPEEPQAALPVSERPYEPPVIKELCMVTANVVKLFKTANIGKGTAMTAAEVRQVVVDYVKVKGLQAERGQVRLDELLAEVVLAKGDNSTACIKWEDLITFVVNKMSPGYSLQFQDQPALEFKGRLEPVELGTATRSGNKKVTLVNNLETYHIDPAQFAHKCQVRRPPPTCPPGRPLCRHLATCRATPQVRHRGGHTGQPRGFRRLPPPGRVQGAKEIYQGAGECRQAEEAQVILAV
jgi:translation initiation factor 2D